VRNPMQSSSTDDIFIEALLSLPSYFLILLISIFFFSRKYKN